MHNARLARVPPAPKTWMVDMRRRFSALLVASVCLASMGVAVAATPGVSGAQDELVTLTIGVTQDLDSPNVTAGYLVSSYEVWNLQYAGLTSRTADDMTVAPGLAESWEVSDDGLTVTYTLREGLVWSDGEPLTADDIAYTINRSRDEEWINHASVTANIDATAIDDRTVEVVSDRPDPRLPALDAYIVPKHIYESIGADGLEAYDGLDGVGSGPYVMDEWNAGESWIMTVNDSYYGWDGKTPPIDRIVYRVFSNGDAMAAALQQGEIDAANNLPSASFERIDADPNIVAIMGSQGSFTELGMNAGAGGIGDGHPALLDKTVRQAIAHAIDRDTLFDRVLLGLGERGTVLVPSADPYWKPELPADLEFTFDPAIANTMLDDAGYLDTDGDGVREMPGGGEPLDLRYVQRSESTSEPQLTEFITGWLEAIGIATTVEVFDDSQLTDVVSAGEFDLFSWGWTPYVDPDPMLSYFTCAQVSYAADDYGYNDANWCTPEYDALYEQQNVELDRETRRDIVHEMVLDFYEEAAYVVLFEGADLQAYRTDRFEGWVRQPAEIGAVFFSNSSPSYTQLTLVGESGDDGGSNTGLLVGAGVVLVAVLAGGVFAMSRRGSADERI